MKPHRVQLSRKKGWRMPENTISVARPGKWGNPFTIAETAARYGLDSDAAQAKAVELCGAWLRGRLDPALSPGDPPSRAESREELSGYNLACWCRPGTPCHADVLIELAND